jgi:2-polyprenyl-3-methyl-5-hydroxy-6-metoxy-1,4-benzoquinol methylase
MSAELRIRGETYSGDEVHRYVTNYKRAIESDPHGRYVAIRELVPRGVRVLDYGCGWGGFSKMLEESGNHVVGIDFEDNEIDICRHVWGESERLSFRRAAITELEDASFDCVVSNEVIEHVHNPGTYLAEINRVLPPQGLLVISLPNVMTPRLMLPSFSPRLPAYLRQVATRTQDLYRKGADHINAWDAPHFVRLVSTVGFEFRDHRPLEGIALPHTRFLPAYVRLPLLRNLSYSMAFVFVKKDEATVGFYD